MPIASLFSRVAVCHLINRSKYHAPASLKQISFKVEAPWFDNEYKEQRVLRRKAEKKWRKSLDPKDHTLFLQINAETNNLAFLKKQAFHKHRLKNAEGDPKAVYSILNKELDRKKSAPLPDNENLLTLAEDFNAFFVKKIELIRKEFPRSQNECAHDADTELPDSSLLQEFQPASVEEIEGIIKDSGIKCSPSDFLPSEVLKKHIGVFSSTLCELVNISLKTGSMDGVKLADVIPTLKGQQLDPENLKNYRPISNLTFLGKLIERVVLARLNEHMDNNNLQSTHTRTISVQKTSLYRNYSSQNS